MASEQPLGHGVSSPTYTIDLPSKIIYDSLEYDYLDLSNYDEKCDITFNLRNNEKLKDICKKTLRFIEKSLLWNTKNANYDVCLQVNYWLYYKLANIIGYNHNNQIEVAFGGFQLAGKNNMGTRSQKTYNDRCKPNFNIFKEDDWGKRKELYEHYVNYDTIYGIAKGYKEKCEEYYEKIKEMISVYKFFEDKCSSKAYKCPDVFDKCKDKNIESSLEDLSCHAIIKARSASILEGESTDQPRDVEQRPLGPADGPQLQLDQADSYTQELTETSGFRKKVTHSVLGAAPVLLTATMLYRV